MRTKFRVFRCRCIDEALQHGALLRTPLTLKPTTLAGSIREGGLTVSGSHQDWGEDPRSRESVRGHSALQPGEVINGAGEHGVSWKIAGG